MLINKEELLRRLEEKYGNLSDDSGCYVNGEWFSLESIVCLIEEC